MESKKFLFGMTLSELSDVCLNAGQKEFVAKQLAHWLYKKNVKSFDQMKNISVEFKKYISDNYELGRIEYKDVIESTDGTKKYLFPFAAGLTETAMIPGDGRHTVCVSSQSGCRFACSFCATGANGFNGQLRSGEILEQIYSIEEYEELSNIVYMGMGEPMDNIAEVLKSIEILTSDWGKGMSPYRITVSTIGIPDLLNYFLSKTNVSIALSVHSPFHEERMTIIPAEKTHPIIENIRVLRKHRFSQHRRLTFEYVIFKGMNHSYKHAKELASLLRGLNARINLIPYNSIPGLSFESPENYIMEQFKREMELLECTCTIRNSRGMDINAACGLLAGELKETSKNSFLSRNEDNE